MARPQRFADYPAAVEVQNVSYEATEDNNPPLRGFPVVVASALICRFGFLQRFLYENAGFGKVKEAPSLQDVPRRYKPTVIPLADGAAPPAKPEIGPELYAPQPADWTGRYYSAADYHALYKSGEVTPLQVVEALLPLINREREPPSEYALAWLAVHEDEVRAAARASAQRWAEGRPLGILDGVPFGVKDDIDVEGFVSTMGMRVDASCAYFARPCRATAWPARQLAEAGAVMVGKMNQHELGMDVTGCNPATGTPVNWMNRAYYPGGSSSGAGSSLSAGLVPIAVGTDAGGSCRLPPCFAGAYSLKPSHDRICLRDSSVGVIGPMASTVADLTVAYRLMAQPDPEDPAQALFAPSARPDPSAPRYLGVCRAWVARADPAVVAAFDAALEHYRARLGYEVVDIDIPHLREGRLAHSAICLTEAADAARARAPPGTHWLGMMSPANRVLLALGAHTPARDYLAFMRARQALMQHLAALFARWPGLLVVTPTAADPGWPVHPGDARHGFSDGDRTLRAMLYAWLANLTGCPAAQAPVGYAAPAEGTEGRLPVGMMAMAEWGAEEQLLGWAAEAEAYLNGGAVPGGRARPPGWVDVLGRARGEVKGAE